MNINKFKQEICTIVDNLNDAAQLKAIKIFIEMHILNPDEPKLSEWQLKRIEESER